MKKKIKALFFLTMMALLAISATVPAGAQSKSGYVVIRNEAPYHIHEFQVWIYPDDHTPQDIYDGATWCQYDRRDGSYDELWFSTDRGCAYSDSLRVWVRVWKSRNTYEDHIFRKVPWNTRLTLTGNGWLTSNL